MLRLTFTRLTPVKDNLRPDFHPDELPSTDHTFLETRTFKTKGRMVPYYTSGGVQSWTSLGSFLLSPFPPLHTPWESFSSLPRMVHGNLFSIAKARQILAGRSLDRIGALVFIFISRPVPHYHGGWKVCLS